MADIFVPEELKKLKQWLVWGPKNTEGKALKTPYYTNGKSRYGTQGSAEDLSRLDTFENAMSLVLKQEFQGVGFTLLKDDGYIMVDLDHAYSDEGILNPRVESIIKSCDSYTEKSYSGKGFHILCKGQTKTNKHAKEGVEMYCGSQYFLWTGNVYENRKEIKEIKPEVLSKLNATIDRFKGIDADKKAKLITNVTPQQNDAQRTFILCEQALKFVQDVDSYENWLAVGMALKAEFGDDGFSLWDEWSRTSAKYDSKTMSQKWRSFSGDGIKIASVFAQAIAGGYKYPKIEKPLAKTPENLDKKVDETISISETVAQKYSFDFWKILRPFGYDRDILWFFSELKKQIRPIDTKNASRQYLMSLATKEAWLAQFPTDKDPTKIDWDEAVNALNKKSAEFGVYKSSMIRGRGCWIDEGRTVLHLGNRVICDNKSTPLNQFDTKFVYELSDSIQGAGDSEINQDEIRHLIKLSHDFRWEMPASEALLLGWCVLAPICGSLNWRPHIWLSGGTGSGKSSILNLFIHQMMGGLDIQAQGNSTEAGIRQALHADARPVLFDEAEQNDEGERRRMQGVIALARQASSESEAKTLKGTTKGTAIEYHIRSMFAWASIQNGIKMQADETRIVVLGLKSLKKDDANQSNWADLEFRLAQIKSGELGKKLLARTMRLIPTIQASISVFVRECTKLHGTARLGDTYGTLLAGLWSLLNESVPTEIQARELIENYDWNSYTEDAQDDEATYVLQSIMQISINSRADSMGVVSIGELVSQVIKGTEDYTLDELVNERAALARYGIKVLREKILIANKCDLLEKSLREKPWGTKWKSYLERIEGAEKIGVTHFATGFVQRCTALPISLLG